MRTQSENATSAGNQQERPQLHPWYITGLVDGEGYFSVYTRIRRIDRWTVKEVALRFGIELKKSDKHLLEKVLDYFKVGRLYLKRDDRPKFTDLYMYRVERHQDIFEKIIPFFKTYPLQNPSKIKSFEIFEQIATMVKDKKHIDRQGFEQIRLLSKKMH